MNVKARSVVPSFATEAKLGQPLSWFWTQMGKAGPAPGIQVVGLPVFQYNGPTSYIDADGNLQYIAPICQPARHCCFEPAAKIDARFSGFSTSMVLV
jgi:hypothetical protein